MKKPAYIKVASREWRLIVHSSSSRMLVFWIPLVVFLLLAGIYTAGALRKIPVAVLDQDHSDLSRTIINYLNASPETKVTTSLQSQGQLKDFFLTHPEKAVYYFPKGMEKDMLKGKSSGVKVMTNSTNIIYGNVLKRNAYELLETVSGGVLVRRLTAQGLTPAQARRLALPIAVNSKPLFNTEYNYLYYLVPGLLTVLLQMIVFFLGARSINKELSAGREQQMLETADYKFFHVIAGKLLVYTLIGMVLAMFTGTVFKLFGIPYQHQLGDTFLLFFFFSLANASLGMMLSSLVSEEIVALDIALFYNSPAFIFSGFTFPILGMPFLDSLWAKFIPYTYFLHAFFKLFEMGAPLAYANTEFLALSAFALTGVITTYVALKVKFKKAGQPELTLKKA